MERRFEIDISSNFQNIGTIFPIAENSRFSTKRQNRGSFKCLNLKTGEEIWTTNKMGWGTGLIVNDYLLCMDIKGNLFLMKPGPEKFNEITPDMFHHFESDGECVKRIKEIGKRLATL